MARILRWWKLVREVVLGMVAAFLFPIEMYHLGLRPAKNQSDTDVTTGA